MPTSEIFSLVLTIKFHVQYLHLFLLCIGWIHLALNPLRSIGLVQFHPNNCDSVLVVCVSHIFILMCIQAFVLVQINICLSLFVHLHTQLNSFCKFLASASDASVFLAGTFCKFDQFAFECRSLKIKFLCKAMTNSLEELCLSNGGVQGVHIVELHPFKLSSYLLPRISESHSTSNHIFYIYRITPSIKINEFIRVSSSESLLTICRE